MNSPAYRRQNQTWSSWLGKTGTVIASTVVRVAAPDRSGLTPYSLVLVDFGEVKRELMGAGHQVFVSGDVVTCVLRKTAVGDARGVIEYGIKVVKNI